MSEVKKTTHILCRGINSRGERVLDEAMRVIVDITEKNTCITVRPNVCPHTVGQHCTATRQNTDMVKEKTFCLFSFDYYPRGVVRDENISDAITERVEVAQR